MLYFTRWKVITIILTALLVCLFAVPNFVPEATVKSWPKWAQRHIVLGLDLQGGAHLLLEVDANFVKKEKVTQVADEVRNALRPMRSTVRDGRLQYNTTIRADGVDVRVSDAGDVPAALAKLR
jgi:preprotein translocase subunit SecD